MRRLLPLSPTALLALTLVACAQVPLAPDPGTPPTLGACTLFPADNIWNVRVDTLPLDPGSAAYVATIDAGAPLHPDFGSGLWQGEPIGIPYTVVTAGQARVPVTFTYAGESDPGPYPVPEDAPIEGGSDRHVLVVDESDCTLYELFAAERQGAGWSAGSGAVFDLDSNTLRPDGWTSADAAGLPILPGLVRYDEVAAGEIRHALRFTAPQTRRAYVWPARHFASDLTGAAFPPLGQRFRLRTDIDPMAFSAQARPIVVALQRYGMILADNGSPWFLSGVPDERWDNDALRDLRDLRGSDFEAVDASGLMQVPDSGRALP